MASIIRIKRSSVSGNPATLAAGELAYSALTDNGSNGGDRLYIGIGTETTGNAANHFVIGGKYFTDMMDHNRGTLTASSAILVDADKKIDDLYVDNIQLNGNTIGTTDTNGNLVLNPNGTGKVSIANAYTLPRTDGTVGQALITNGSGVVSFTTISTTLNISGDGATTDSVSLITDTLAFTGGTGIDTTVSNNQVTIALEASVIKSVTTDSGELVSTTNALSILGGEGMDVTHAGSTITIAGEDATTSNKGIASFDSGDFSVTAGAVSIKTGGVANSQLENSSITIGSTTVSLGGTSTSLAGVTELTVDQININGNTISSTDTNGNIILDPNGSGTVEVSNSRITGLAEPVSGTDAATKNYVDNSVSGLTWKDSVNLLATTNVALTGSTATLVIDGHAALDDTDVGYRILLKGQSTSSENGIYTYTDNGTAYTLVRSDDANTYQELVGAAVLVKEGTAYANTGWVQNNHYLSSFSGQSWSQFSGAGAYSAGAGLGQTGTEFFVNVAAAGGIEIVADALQLKSSLAGDGLAYASGVLSIGGTTNRISVSADAIDISENYVGQTSITTLGTIATGTWNATTIATTKGGTGLTSYATGDLLYASATDTLSKLSAGADGKVLQINSSGVPVWGDIDGGTY